MTTIETGNDTGNHAGVAAGALAPLFSSSSTPPDNDVPDPAPAAPESPKPAAETAAGEVDTERATEPPRPGRARLIVVFVALLLTVVLAAIDLTAVATALPTIAGDLQGLGTSSWILTAYLLGVTVTLPAYAGLGSRFGRRGMFVFAGLLFLVGSLLSGSADTMTQLITYRAVQGVGAGGLLIGAQAIVTELAAPGRRARYVGIIGTVFGLSTLGGPLLGGYLVEFRDWRWVFLINVPLVALALLIALVAARLPKRAQKPRPDLWGALFLAVLSSCAVFVAAWGGTRYAWDSPVILGLAGGGVVALLAFVLAERYAGQPIVPLRLFRDSIFSVGGLIALITGFAMVGAIAFLPLFLQTARGATPFESGVLLLPLVGGVFVASVIAGRVTVATGHYKVFPILGMLSAGAGMYLLSELAATTSDLYNGLAMGLLGIGIGLVLPVLSLAVQNSARTKDAGAATATMNYLRQLGGSIGVATFGALFLPQLSGSTVESVLPPAFWYGVPVLGAGLLLALFLRQIPLAPEPAGAWYADEELEQVSTDNAASRNGFVYVSDPTSDSDVTGGDAAVPAQHPMPKSEDQLDAYGAGDRIRVFVRQEDGAPIKGAVLTLIDTAGNQAGRSTAAGDGVYHIPAPDSGAYVLISRADFHNPCAVQVHVGEGSLDVEVVLGGESGLGGVVYAPDGSTVDSATVTLSDSQGSVVATRTTDADGEYEFADLLPGSYTLTVNGPSLQPAAMSIRVPESGRIRQDVRLTGGSEIYGTAWTRRDHRPIPEARVTLLDTTGTVLAVTTTDNRGHYEFANMTDGDYTVVASCYPPSASPVTVSDGQAIEHDVVLGYGDEEPPKPVREHAG